MLAPPQARPRPLCCLVSKCSLSVGPWVAPGGLHKMASSPWLWGPVTGSGSSWTWGPTNPTCSSLLKGLESQMGHPHPWLQQAFLTDSAPHLVFPRGSGQPPGEGGGGLGVCL